MPYYTPSPMVNFQFDPNPSDAQRIVDTTNKIEKQRMEEQTKEMEFKEAQMQFQESAMKMKASEIKMQEAVKAQELDVLAEQTYNGTLAATGDRAEALRSAFAVQAKAGGFAKQRENEQKSMAKIEEIMKQDYLDPQEAQLVADYRTAMSPVGVRITADSVTQEHSRAHAKYDVKTGEYAYRDASGELVVEQKMSEQKAGSIKAEEERKKKETEDKIATNAARIDNERARTGVMARNAALSAGTSSANAKLAADTAEKNRQNRLETTKMLVEGRTNVADTNVESREYIEGLKSADKALDRDLRTQAFNLKEDQEDNKQEELRLKREAAEASGAEKIKLEERRVAVAEKGLVIQQQRLENDKKRNAIKASSPTSARTAGTKAPAARAIPPEEKVATDSALDARNDVLRLREEAAKINPRDPAFRMLQGHLATATQTLERTLRSLEQHSPSAEAIAGEIRNNLDLPSTRGMQKLPEPAPPVTLPTSAAAIPVNPLVGNATQAVSLGGLTKFQKFNMQMEGR